MYVPDYQVHVLQQRVCVFDHQVHICNNQLCVCVCVWLGRWVGGY